MGVGFGAGSPIGNTSILNSGIDLWDAPVNITLAYNGSSTVTVTLSQTGSTWSGSYPANLASTLGGAGTQVYFGFGGSQGGATAIQEVSNFSIASLGNTGLPTTSAPANRRRRGRGPQRPLAGRRLAFRSQRRRRHGHQLRRLRRR